VTPQTLLEAVCAYTGTDADDWHVNVDGECVELEDEPGECAPGWSIAHGGGSGWVVTRTAGWYIQTGDAGSAPGDVVRLMRAMAAAHAALEEAL
jgi:hypothetical protein